MCWGDKSAWNCALILAVQQNKKKILFKLAKHLVLKTIVCIMLSCHTVYSTFQEHNAAVRAIVTIQQRPSHMVRSKIDDGTIRRFVKVTRLSWRTSEKKKPPITNKAEKELHFIVIPAVPIPPFQEGQINNGQLKTCSLLGICDSWNSKNVLVLTVNLVSPLQHLRNAEL